MEELFTTLKNRLKNSIEIKADQPNLIISIIIKSEVKGKIAEPDEVLVMLKMFGGLREEVPLDIEIDNENRKINLKFENMENFEKILDITTKIWDNAVDMLIQVTDGNFDVIRDIPDVDE